MIRAKLDKKQLKRARYLANKLFGQGGYYRREGSDDTKVRNYVDENGIGVAWTETLSGPDYTVTTEFVSKEGHCEFDKDLDELLTLLGFDSNAKDALSRSDYAAGPYAEPEPHQDIVDTVKTAVEFVSTPGDKPEPPAEVEVEAESVVEAPTDDTPENEGVVKRVDADVVLAAPVSEVKIEAHLDAARGKDTAAVVETINPRAKRDKCATMRLAKEYGLPTETEFAKIVERFGNDAVVRYQELLRLVPSFGLTEADVRHQFPSEYAALPL